MEDKINNALKKELIKEIVKSQKHLKEIKIIKKEVKAMYDNFNQVVREIRNIRNKEPITHPEVVKLREQITAHSIGVQNVYEEMTKIKEYVDTKPVKELIEYLKPESIDKLRKKALEIKFSIESMPYDLIEKFENFRESVNDLHNKIY